MRAPDSVDTYVHRSGRTGRAGKNGTCVVLYTPREAPELDFIQRRTGLVSFCLSFLFMYVCFILQLQDLFPPFVRSRVYPSVCL